MVQKLLRAAAFCLALLIPTGVLTFARLDAMQTHIADNVLRLHVIANSNYPQDQAIKHKVRDRILTDCGYLFDRCQDADTAVKIARQAAPLLRKAAEKELRQNGYLYPVSVTVSPSAFPTKDYGGVRLPAGTYTAIRVRIGSGGGKNWWCVMYPPLCLTKDAVKADEETLKTLRQSLTAEEYAMVTETEKMQVHVKFKLAEWIAELRK